MYTIIHDDDGVIKYRTDRGAWIPKLYPGYNLCSYSEEIDAEIAAGTIENKERKDNLKVVKIKKVKMGEY